jgi:enoyl-[acyl-carrier protein] reductase / trans-2-enoyl-CoA reductase (NAD+)
MSSQVIAARIRGFICLNAHPAGCAANVDAEIAVAQEGAGAPGTGMGAALVIGGSTGYGLSSLLSAVFGYGAQGTAVCLERPPQGEKTASAGWYNLAGG